MQVITQSATPCDQLPTIFPPSPQPRQTCLSRMNCLWYGPGRAVLQTGKLAPPAMTGEPGRSWVRNGALMRIWIMPRFTDAPWLWRVIKVACKVVRAEASSTFARGWRSRPARRSYTMSIERSNPDGIF